VGRRGACRSHARSASAEVRRLSSLHHARARELHHAYRCASRATRVMHRVLIAHCRVRARSHRTRSE
jgi:hypothetical protein